MTRRHSDKVRLREHPQGAQAGWRDGGVCGAVNAAGSARLWGVGAAKHAHGPNLVCDRSRGRVVTCACAIP